MTVTTKDVKEVFPDAKVKRDDMADRIGVAAEALAPALLPDPTTGAATWSGPSVRNIFQRMNGVMKDVRGVAKDQFNRHGNYKYQGHLAVAAALRESYVEHGIVRSAEVTKAEREGGLLRLYVDVSWINIDNPSDRHVVRSMGESAKMTTSGEASPVQVGVAMSYAVKVAELKAFSLTDDDTPDADEESEGQPRQAAPKAPATPPKTNVAPVSSEDIRNLLSFYTTLSTKAELDAHRKKVGGVLTSVTAEEYKALEKADEVATLRLNQKKA